MFDTLIVNAVIITVDRNNRVIDKGYAAVQNGKIAAIGSMQELSVYPQAKNVLDLSGHAVLPGLIDGHGHGGHCLIRTLGEHYDAEWDGMAEDIYYNCTDEEFWYREAVLAAAERIRFGTTTAVSMIGSTPRVDSILPVRANLAGSVSVGIRQFSGIGVPNGPWPKKNRIYEKDGSYYDTTVDTDHAIAVIEQSVKELNGVYERGYCICAPGRMGKRPGNTDEENIRQNREMYRIAENYHVPLHTHAYGGDVQFLYDTSPEVLTPSLSLTHSTGYSDREIDILAETGSWVFHGPTTYANANGHCRLMDMLKKGVHAAIVTDGTAPDRSYDLWRDMKNAMLIQRYNERNYGVLPCGTVLRMVTIEPAKALGIDHLTGSLEVGKSADLIAVDVQQPHLAPFGIMPVQRLVNHAMGQDVDTVMIEGEIVMENRKLIRVDEEKIIRDAGEAFDRMFHRLNRPEVLLNPHLYDMDQYQ